MMKQLLSKRDKKKLSNGRIEELKPKLPKKWRKMVVAIAPEYDTLQGTTLMQNFHQGRSTDENLLNIWEIIIAEDGKKEKRTKQSQSRAKIAFPV
jgi:hypothetical protein